MTYNQSWSLIVFGFNERESLSSVVSEAHDIMLSMEPSQYEIIIVDDGSRDGSAELSTNLARENPQTVRTILQPKNLGIGHALLAGYSAARFDNICAVPADGQFNLDELKPHVNVNEDSVISFFREKKEGYSFYRRALTALNRWLNRIAGGFTLKDVNWVKIYKREELQKLNLLIRSSLVESEICAKLLRRGFKAIEVPSHYKPRRAGHSKAANFKNLIFVVRETVRLYLILLKDSPPQRRQ